MFGTGGNFRQPLTPLYIIFMAGDVSLPQVMRRLQSLYGTTSGDTLLELFYSQPQEEGESFIAFCTRLEECVYAAAEKGAVQVDAIPAMLRSRFGAGLVDSDVKNTLRPRKHILDIEELVKEARALTDEFKSRGSSGSKKKVSLQREDDRRPEEAASCDRETCGIGRRDEEALKGSENGGSTAQHGTDILQCLSAEGPRCVRMSSRNDTLLSPL